MFFDYYKKIGLKEAQFYLIFSIILKDKAFEFYYDNIIKRSYDFYIIVNLMRSHFEIEENR